MNDAAKRYTEREFSLILAKAAELTGSTKPTADAPAGGLTIDEVKSIAAEVGLDPDSVDRAARLIPDEDRPSLLGRILGGTFRARRSFSMPGEFTEERAQILLASARRTVKTHGEGEVSPSDVSWSTKDDGHVFVSGHGDGSETRVQIAVDNRALLVLPLTFGPAGVVAAVYAAIAAGDSGFANPYAILAAGTGLTAAWVWWMLRRITGKTRATLENLIDAIGDGLDREPPG